MQIFFFVLFVALAECKKSSYFVDENILDEVFDKFEYEENDDDIKVSDVEYDYYYEDEDQSTIPGKAGRDYPIYSDVPITTFNCKGNTLIKALLIYAFFQTLFQFQAGSLVLTMLIQKPAVRSSTDALRSLESSSSTASSVLLDQCSTRSTTPVIGGTESSADRKLMLVRRGLRKRSLQ